VINLRKRSLIAVVKERQLIADGLLRALDRLGLHARARSDESLPQYLARYDAAKRK
jgi:hypothetical protein